MLEEWHTWLEFTFLAPGPTSKLLKQSWISPNKFQFRPSCIVRIILLASIFSLETILLSLIHTEHNLKLSAQELTSLAHLRAENRRKLTKRNRDGILPLQCNTKLSSKIFTGIYIYIYIYIYIRGVTGGTDQTSGGCSLCYTIPI